MELGLGIDEIGVLLLEEDLALFKFVVFLNRIKIDRAHRFDALRQIGDDLLDAFQSKASPCSSGCPCVFGWRFAGEAPGAFRPRSPPPEHRELFSCCVPVKK